MDVYTKERATTQQLLMKGSVRRDVDAVVDGLIFIGQVPMLLCHIVPSCHALLAMQLHAAVNVRW